MASKKTLEHYLRQMRLIEEHREKWCEENIRRHYRDLSKDLTEFLGVQYAALAKDDKLTYEILHEKASYARFLEEVEQRVNKFSPQAAQEIRDTVQLTYEHAYKGMVDAVEKSGTVEELHNQLQGVRAVRPETIKNVVQNKIMEKALEKNHKGLIYNIRQEIGIGLSQGDRMSTMAKRLSTQVEGGYKKAMLIARTEVHRAREAGYQDSSERMVQILKENDSDYVLVKTWKTMQDMSVRPYRSKGKKGKKTFVKGKGPDHVKMHGVTILVDEQFDLGDGNKTKTPGQSGVAGHDCNCRCYLSRDLITKAEYEALTGKKLVNNKIAQYETEEKILLDEKKHLESEQSKLIKKKENLESYEYQGIWKETVTPADYELKESSIQKKKDYYEKQIDKYSGPAYANSPWAPDEVNKMKNYLKQLDDFEAQGKTYLKLKKQLGDIDNDLLTLDDNIKDVRLKLMKANGINPDKMQKEIDDLISEINKLSGVKTTSSPLQYKVKDIDPDKVFDYMYEALEKQSTSAPPPKDVYEKLWKPKISKHGDLSLEEFADHWAMSDELKDVFKSKIKVKGKNLTLKSKINEFEPGQINAIYKKFVPNSAHDIEAVFGDDSVENVIEFIFTKDEQTAFKKELKKLIKNNPDDAKALKKLQKQLKDKQDELDKIKKRYGLEDDVFSQKRKDNALWFTDKNGGAKAADAVYRDKAGEVWRKATKPQRDSAYEYTSSYHKYNEPLRGIEYGTNKFLGVGNVDLDNIGVLPHYPFKKGEVHKLIDDLTDYIDMSSYDQDVWLNRGCRRSGMDKFFGIKPSDFNLSEKELAAKLLGTTPTEYGFMSTGVARGTGFSGEIKLNIYAPKGTKMAYVEPFSAFGNGHGKNWDGIKKQSSIGYEAEMLLQRNTQFRVIKVEKQGSQWYIDMEVISQKR